MHLEKRFLLLIAYNSGKATWSIPNCKLFDHEVSADSELLPLLPTHFLAQEITTAP